MMYTSPSSAEDTATGLHVGGRTEKPGCRMGQQARRICQLLSMGVRSPLRCAQGCQQINAYPESRCEVHEPLAERSRWCRCCVGGLPRVCDYRSDGTGASGNPSSTVDWLAVFQEFQRWSGRWSYRLSLMLVRVCFSRPRSS